MNATCVVIHMPAEQPCGAPAEYLFNEWAPACADCARRLERAAVRGKFTHNGEKVTDANVRDHLLITRLAVSEAVTGGHE